NRSSNSPSQRLATPMSGSAITTCDAKTLESITGKSNGRVTMMATRSTKRTPIRAKASGRLCLAFCVHFAVSTKPLPIKAYLAGGKKFSRGGFSRCINGLPITPPRGEGFGLLRLDAPSDGQITAPDNRRASLGKLTTHRAVGELRIMDVNVIVGGILHDVLDDI